MPGTLSMPRVLTFNVLTMRDASGERRQVVARELVRGADADVVALQEVTRSPDFDQAADLLGPGYTILDVPGGDPTYGGECLASRLPVERSWALDLPIAEHAGRTMRAGALAVEVIAPPPVGPLLCVHHKGTYELNLEYVRERQALATARFVEQIAADVPVVLLGDFNAAPDAASVRFLTGRQSLDGYSVRYDDAWAAAHPDDHSHTFSPRNPLVRAGQMPLERGRRIDHILVRSGPHGPLLDVAACEVVFDQAVDGVWASDHFGLLAELRPPCHAPGTWA
jgi:endonuclease/exonuclease/phosphatase family metal-dependent hydrolase